MTSLMHNMYIGNNNETMKNNEPVKNYEKAIQPQTRNKDGITMFATFNMVLVYRTYV